MFFINSLTLSLSLSLLLWLFSKVFTRSFTTVLYSLSLCLWPHLLEMDHQHQDHPKNHSSVVTGDQESHHGHGGVHLCHRCGWPFPNPHPSAKHRRAHKRVCGTIEGYKLLNSEDNPHSDDDHSDDDPKTPSPKPAERSISKKGSGGIGSASNRSEDEVFSDAVTEFQESGITSGIEGHLEEASDPTTNVEVVIKNDGNSTGHLKDNTIADSIEPSGNSTSITHSQIPEVQKSMTDLLESMPESLKYEPSSIEEVAVLPGDRSGSSLELFVEKLTDVPEFKKINADDEVTARSMTYIGPETDDNEIAEIIVDRNIADIVLQPSGNASKISEEVSEFDNLQKITSDSMQGGAQLEEEHGNRLSPMVLSTDLLAKDDSVDHSNASVDGVQIKMDAAQVIDSSSSANLVEGCNEKVEGNEHVHVLSVPGDLHLVDNAEILLGEFKDYRGVNLHQSGTLDLGEKTKDEKVDLKDSGSETNFITLLSTQLGEGTEVYASDTHVLKDNLNHESRNTNPFDKTVPVEGEVAVPKIKLINDEALNELEAHTDSLEEGRDSRPAAAEVHVEGEADVSHIKPMNNEGSNELEALASNLEYEIGNKKPIIEKGHVEGEANIPEIKLTDNVVSNVIEAPADNFEHEGEKGKLVVDEVLVVGEVDFLEAKLVSSVGSTELEGPTDKFEHEDRNRKPIIEEVLVEGKADVTQFNHGNNKGLSELEAPADNLEHEGGNDNPMVEKVAIEGEADVPWIKFINNSGLGEIKSPADDHEHETGKSQPMTDKVSIEGEDDVSTIKHTNNLGPYELEAPADKLEHKGGSGKLVFKNLPIEGEVDEPQIELRNIEGSDESEILTDAVTIEIEKSHTVSLPKEQQPHDVCDHLSQSDHSSQMIPLVTATDILPDTNFMAAPVDAEVNLKTNSVVFDGAGNREKTADICDLAENDKKIAEEKTESTIGTSESGHSIFKYQTVLTSSFLEVRNGGDDGKGIIENYDVAFIESRGGPEGNLSVKAETVGGSVSDLHESQIVVEDVIGTPVGKSQGTEYSDVDRVSETRGGVKKLGTNDNQVEEEGVNEVTLAAKIYHSGDIKLSSKSLEGDLTKEPHLAPLDTESSVQSSKSLEGGLRKKPHLARLDTESSVQSASTVENKQAMEFGADASGFSSQSLQGEGNDSFVKHHLGVSAIDASVDSSSQTDSLEGNWGSVSVLSAQSDTTAVVDTEERANLQKPKGPSEGIHSDKPEMFEPPSFMTLVEPQGPSDQKATEIQTVQSFQEQKAASLQAGWFPSLTNVANDSQGRKKNEEIIAKVTNWSTGKQHTPLKSLLGEANRETKPKSPKPKENQASVVKKDESVGIDDGAVASKVSSNLAPAVPVSEPARSETAKEWNSPARYPADIKREKRKVKGRPYWAQFVCCSSVN